MKLSFKKGDKVTGYLPVSKLHFEGEIQSTSSEYPASYLCKTNGQLGTFKFVESDIKKFNIKKVS